jgi:hypothetical protein
MRTEVGRNCFFAGIHGFFIRIETSLHNTKGAATNEHFVTV